MIRKFTLTLLMVLALGYVTFGQYTASLPTVTASPNENVAFNLSVTNFDSVWSFQFYIQYDTSVLTFTNATNFTGSGLMTGGSAGVLTLIWTSANPNMTWNNGTLMTLNFKYKGLSSALAFSAANCEVTKKLVGHPLPVVVPGSFTNGAISPFLGNAAHATIDNVTSALGTVQVPLKFTGFPTNVGSITQKVTYDPTKLTFINVTGTGNLASGLVSAGPTPGQITITWSNVAGKDINYPASQLNLNFSYTMLATTPVNFGSGCVITTAAPVTNIAVTYYNGSVAPPPVITAYATFGTLTNAVQGQLVDVPLTLSGMGAGTVSAFNVNVTYDNPRMSFVGVLNAMYPITTNAAGNSISISYTNVSAPAINGQFLILRFMYNGIGTAAVNFGAGCQFSNITQLGVGYTNGSVSPATATVNANIGFVAGTSPSTVSVPVMFSNIPGGTNIGAVTMNVSFDNSKLTYVNATNPFGATIQLNGSTLHIAWTTTVATVLNGIPFVTLNFNYAAAGNATALINFADGCQLANLASPFAIVPANWIGGGVNTLFKLTGTLTYYSPSNVALDNVTIQIKDGPEPVAPNVTPVPNVLYTTTTDAAGHYQIYLPNGTYYVYASSTTAWGGVDGGDVTQIRRYIALLSNGIVGNPLRMISADVSQDATIDGTDVTALRRRLANLTPNPNYRAPNWLFENPQVIMSGADVNKDFKGLCSGDVNGSYPN